MKKIILVISILCGACIVNVYADTSRDIIVQKELDCIDQHKSSPLTWSDVCSMPEPSINQQINAIDQQLSNIKGASPSQTTTAFDDRENTFNIGFQGFNNYSRMPLSAVQNQTDYFNPARKDEGFWYGGDAGYTLRPPQDSLLNTPVFNYFALEGFYAKGKNNVTQNVQSIIPPYDYFEKLHIKNIPGYMFEGRILLGRDFIPFSTMRLTPYSGFGIRYKTDQAGGHYDTISDGTQELGYNVSDLYFYILCYGLYRDNYWNKVPLSF